MLMIVGWYLGREYDKSVYKANRDSLTGLFNRRYVLDNIQKSFSKAKRKRNKLAIILLDVNDFKQINDNLGHETGDQVLKCISDLLIDSFASEDIVARWGGDEFLIVSSFTDETMLNQKVSHFKGSIKGKHWRHNGLSVSIGKAIYPSDDKTFESLISKADANMYRFKSYHNSNT
ncbi:pleD [Virgibacillus sp. SK37]|nr:pleD [Virgibacillus sp. SK37]